MTILPVLAIVLTRTLEEWHPRLQVFPRGNVSVPLVDPRAKISSDEYYGTCVYISHALVGYFASCIPSKNMIWAWILEAWEAFGWHF